MQVLLPADFIVQQIVAVPVHWFLARKSFTFNEKGGKLAYYLSRKKSAVLLPFLLKHISIAFLQPPPPPPPQARIHTGFHRFTEIGQIFHKKLIFNNN